MNTGDKTANLANGSDLEDTTEPTATLYGTEPLSPCTSSKSIVLPDAPLSTIDRVQRDGYGWAGALVLAVVGHGGLLAALAWSPPMLHIGADGFEFEATSVEVSLVSASALESLRPTMEMSASATATERREGQLVMPSAMPSAAPTTPREPIERLEHVEASEVVQPHAHDPLPREHAARTADTAPPAVAGGSISRGASIEPTSSSATVMASVGLVAAYTSRIVDALGRTRPRGQAPGRGTVRIVFAVAEDGALADVQVKATSGRSSLDELAMVAVRQARFPPPPAGMTLSQRTYEVPYHFR